MNYDEAWSSGGRRGSRGRYPASGHIGYRPKSEIPVTADRSLNDSYGNRGRGSRGRGTCQPRNSYGHANNKQVFVKKLNPVADLGLEEKRVQQQSKSLEDEIGSTKRQPDVKELGDNKDLLQSSTCSNSENLNLSGGSFVSRECEDKDGTRMSRDLVNQMNDAALSCQESVYSTSCQRAGLSSVVMADHDNAHKSGDAGNSSNESNTKPFDLFLRKNVMGLKPTLLELNKEKRKATKGFIGIFIKPGMVLLKSYLSINDQMCLGLGNGGFYQPGYQDGALLHLKMMCLGKNWDPETSRYGETRPVDGSIPPKIPAEFNQFVEKAIKESQSVVATNSKNIKGEDGIPFMSPDICIVNFYTSSGRLGLHQDKDESGNSIRKGLPVVSFSIGDSAEFLYGAQRDDERAEKVVLESGDVLIFGGKSRNVFHGVRSILKDTAPKVLVQETSLRPGRLNLTFRQY